MNKFLSVLTFLLLCFSSNAQTLIRCSTMEDDSILRASRPMESLDDFENWLQAKISLYKASPEYQRGSRAVVTIPVVVHVIHNGDAVGTSENISQTQINSQIAVLNEDFRKAFGTLGYNTHPAGADCEIEFCLAAVDPNGNILPEPGIDRQNLGQASWEQSAINSTVKPQTIWDPDRYCNIWTVNFGGASANLLGYAQFPSSSGLAGLNNNGGAATTDGVVVRYNAFGRTGTVSSPYNRGRTTTHELGHWLGLRHIWGDQTCGNDFCNDTPTSNGANYGCPTGQRTCNNTVDDMIQNYMDYTNDACCNIYTQDQKTRMITVLNNSPRRNSLTSSNVCTIPMTFSYTGRVVDASTNQGISGASILLDGAADYSRTTDASGYFTVSNLQQDNYALYAGKWGYVTNSIASQAYTPSSGQVTIALQQGYYDDFSFNFGWTVTSTAASGAWVRGVPVGTTYTVNNVTYQSNPGTDVQGDFLNLCYVTGNGGGQAGTDDVDDGTVILTSPAMNLSSYTNPIVRYYRWFFNSGGTGTPNDSLVISLVNGTQVIDIDKVGQGANSNQWVYKSYRVKDYISNPGNNIYLRARTFDLPGTGHLVEAALDYFRVVDSTGITTQAPTANFSSSTTEICAGQQVIFNDLSTNNPTTWAWLFPGGSPTTSNTPNPTITYNTPGIYNVMLTSSNSGGSNSSTLTGYIKVNAVVAQFSQDKDGVCPGQSVTFTSESSCNPTSLEWIFNGGDISTSTSLNPTVSYSLPGYYEVTLIAANQYGRDTLIQNLSVQVYAPPSFTVISTPDTNGSGTGTASINVMSGVIPYTYTWNDPQSQTTTTATGLQSGTYTVTITDGNGCAYISNVQVTGPVSVNAVEDVIIRVYPNPSRTNWILNVSAEYIGTDFLLTDELGRVIVSSRINNETTTVENQKLSSGVYFLKIPAANYVSKLVKW